MMRREKEDKNSKEKTNKIIIKKHENIINGRGTFIITVWAGRLTPQASVAVQTRTLTRPSEKSFSTRFLSLLSIPA